MKVLLVAEGPSELDGALEALVRRLGLSDAAIDTDRVSNKAIHTHRGKGQGFFKRAVRWMFEARNRNYNALILLIDQDGHAERSRDIDKSQDYRGINLPRALGVAIRTFDAWMLADESALSQLTGSTVNRQSAPEFISDPKRCCQDLLVIPSGSMSFSALYARIAAVIDLEILEVQCPKGFGPFAQRVRSLRQSSC
jgi:hypothetical protein